MDLTTLVEVEHVAVATAETIFDPSHPAAAKVGHAPSSTGSPEVIGPAGHARAQRDRARELLGRLGELTSSINHGVVAYPPCRAQLMTYHVLLNKSGSV